MTRASRNWIAYLCENLASSGMMPTWEAATYLTDNLFGDKPNPRLLRTTCPYEDTTHLLHRLYQPLVEAATRDIPIPDSSHDPRLHGYQSHRKIGGAGGVFPGAESAAPALTVGCRQSLGTGV
jgi:hypothetical protein